MNKLKFLLAWFILLGPLGCDDDGKATIDVIKNRIGNQIQNLVGKGDIAVQKYENKIEEVRGNLVKMKKSRMKFEGKLRKKQTQLAIAEASEDSSPEKIALLKGTIQEMEKFLEQVGQAEIKIGDTLKKLIDNLELVKLKVATLEAKREMLEAMRDLQQYTSTNFEGEVSSLGSGMESTLDDMQDDIYEIEAELEIEKLLAE